MGRRRRVAATLIVVAALLIGGSSNPSAPRMPDASAPRFADDGNVTRFRLLWVNGELTGEPDHAAFEPVRTR